MKNSITVLALCLALTGCAKFPKPCPVPPPPPIQPAPAPVAEAPAPVAPAPAPVVEAPAAPATVTASAEPVRDYAAEFKANVHDVFFDSDRSNLTAEQGDVVNADAKFLAANPNIKFNIVSSCDVSGSAAYNQRLGIKRFETVLNALSYQGAKPESASTIGKTAQYGDKSQNRRVHFTFEGTN